MKIATILTLIAMVSIPVLAEEIDSEIITVQTGWTQEKAELSEYWANLSGLGRQTELANLETRMAELLPRLPENEYSYEENKLVGYRIRLQETFQQLNNELSPMTYAEFVSNLNQAEHFVWYIEREQTLPHTSYEEEAASYPEQINGRDDLPRQGIGWEEILVDGSYKDHQTPSIASLGDTIFVASSNTGNDTVYTYRSVDGGYTWSQWYVHGTPTADRLSFDLAIDPVNHYLYLAYHISSGTISGNIWIRRFTDFSDSSATDIYAIEDGSDACHQPHLSVEHEYTGHRLCCMYYNEATGNVVIARSEDYGQTWVTVHTSAWTVGADWPKPKGAQGASTATTDKFYFVAQKETNSLVVFESTSGGAGVWTETEYIHGQDIDAVDISASHNHLDASVVVSFGYVWLAADYNIRILFRPETGPGFISQLVDGDGLMTKTPVISCDGEWAPNTTGPDYYHLSYYKDHNDDTYYMPFALRCLNDSASLGIMYKDSLINFEVVGPNVIDTLTTSIDYGFPAFFYQIDMTTIWNAYNTQWFPAIIWMRYWDSSPFDRDLRLSIPEYDFGIEESEPREVSRFVSLAPNPSHGAAKLSYAIHRDGNVTISLYDATGRLVNNLFNEIKQAGEYSLTINEQNLAAGVYFIRVEIPEGVATKALTIIR